MSGEVSIERSFYFAPFARATRAKVTLFRRRAQVLDFAGREAIKEIQKEIRRSSWLHPPKRLLKSWSYKVGPNTVKISSDHPAAKFLDEGVKRHQMSPPRRRVPIITDDGRLIFRDMTAKSLADGRWIHPGYHGKHFLRRGAKKARERIKQILADNVIAQVGEIMGFRR
jgi:hypothetical protein